MRHKITKYSVYLHGFIYCWCIMEDMHKISVAINTYNSAKYLPEVLDSLKGFDEVVVCDMESTDDTVSIAHAHGCRVVTFPKNDINICEPARNTAIRSASNGWVLVLDDDELVTPPLYKYLYDRVMSDDCPEGLDIPFVNKLMGEFDNHVSEYHVRFFRRDKVDWPPVIHARPVVDGRVERVPRKSACILHINDASIADRITKLNRYSDNEVPKRALRSYGAAAMLMRPLWFFLKSYLLKGNIRYGRRGIVRSYFECMYQMALLAKITEYRMTDSR